jgi:pyruvate/2-oxoglutarate dehydrogenase complex dihydrolipoamide dehydrogenase (E3) component
VLDREDRIGGQMALAGAAPGHVETAATLVRNYERLLAGAEVRLGVPLDAEAVAALSPDAVVVATGARPYMPELELGGVEVHQAWDVLGGERPRLRQVVVADWGGDASGLDCAELLAAEEYHVTLAVAAVAAGEAIHQYQRNLYLERLYRAGVRIEHHLELTGARGGRAVFRNLFARELETSLEGALVLALGRVPVDELAPALSARGLRVEEAGDCRGPRSLEEAVLEGTLAARTLLVGRQAASY